MCRCRQRRFRFGSRWLGSDIGLDKIARNLPIYPPSQWTAGRVRKFGFRSQRGQGNRNRVFTIGLFLRWEDQRILAARWCDDIVEAGHEGRRNDERDHDLWYS